MEEIKVEVSNDDLYQGEDKDDLYPGEGKDDFYSGEEWEEEHFVKQVSRLLFKWNEKQRN